MVDSRRFLPADDAVRASVADMLRESLPQGGDVAVALSGGRDSFSLLHAAARVVPRAGGRVLAFHVHHGLSANADRWVRFCRDACAAMGIDLATREVCVARRAGIGIEAAARTARYDALAALARERGIAAVLLAHHADDQAETLLLQLLRGAGPRGLAAMSPSSEHRGVLWLRPLLALPRTAIDAYVAAHAIGYIDDESNADVRFRRNALRQTVIPALRSLAPGYPRPLVHAVSHQAEAAALLDDLAAIDAGSACDGPTLARDVLRTLGPPRARNLLRWFLRRQGLRAPSSARLSEMLRQIVTARDDARVAIAVEDAEVGLHRGRVHVHRTRPEAFLAHWDGESAIALPHGTLRLTPTQGSGIALQRLTRSPVTVCNGRPGERLRLRDDAPRRALADLLREAGVPAWERHGLPRIYCGDRLAAVADVGVDVAFAAADREPSLRIDWQRS